MDTKNIWINNIKIKKIINPNLRLKKEIDDFINKDFFDIKLTDFIGNEIYYIIRDEDKKIIAARKVIFDLQKFLDKTPFYERLKNYINYNKKVYYLQALCVKKEEQNKRK